MAARKPEQKQEPKCALCRNGGHQKSKVMGGEKQELGNDSVGKGELDALEEFQKQNLCYSPHYQHRSMKCL